LLIAALAQSGCGSGGRSGESCTHTGECASDFLCINGECTPADAPGEHTGKVCVLHECREDGDCFGGQVCDDGRCACDDDGDCLLGQTCADGKCVECESDAACSGDEVCVEGACAAACRDDLDCADFYGCRSDRCVWVGCSRDEQCALSNGDVRYRCDGATGLCFQGCSTDAECGPLTDGEWEGLICHEDRCRMSGCTADSDCQFMFPAGTFATCAPL
jgi:hypothetical protein